MTNLNKPNKILRIATRQSPLALWQANYIRAQLLHHWPQLTIELLPMTTSGDQFLKDKLLEVGGKGLFVKELEEALLEKRADLAVHSMKDVPANLPDGLFLAAIGTRHNPFDALISKKQSGLSALPLGAIIGTSSLRRQSQLLAIRPDLKIIPLRGNIHTRIAKMDTELFDAIVLAVAGLERMGLDDLITEILPEDIMLPACGQGALGIECRLEDAETQLLIAPLNDTFSTYCVTAERQVNALLGGNCHVPLAVYCTVINNSTLSLRAKVASPDGQIVIQEHLQGDILELSALAEQCAHLLLQNGAADLLAKK